MMGSVHHPLVDETLLSPLDIKIEIAIGVPQ